jgi:hypothetical protein
MKFKLIFNFEDGSNHVLSQPMIDMYYGNQTLDFRYNKYSNQNVLITPESGMYRQYYSNIFSHITGDIHIDTETTSVAASRLSQREHSRLLEDQYREYREATTARQELQRRHEQTEAERRRLEEERNRERRPWERFPDIFR